MRPTAMMHPRPRRDVSFRPIGTIGHVLALGVALVGPVVLASTTDEVGSRVWALAWVGWAPVGFAVLVRRPGQRCGIALLRVGWTVGVGLLGFALAATDVPLALARWAELSGRLLGVVSWITIGWLLLIFPTGRYAGPAERMVGRLLVVFGLLAVAAFTLSPERMDVTEATSPLALHGVGEALTVITGTSGLLGVAGLLVVSVGLLARRWRHSSGHERAQFRWFSLGSAIFATIIFVGQFAPDGPATLYLWVLSGFAIPVSVGIAVTRYRLFEIDHIISRTVAYSTVALLVAGLYGLVAIGPVLVLGEGRDTPPWLTAAATLAAFAAFAPLRRRVQGVVDRRFDRARYDARRIIDGFSRQVRDQTTTTAVASGLGGVAGTVFHPISLSVWVRVERPLVLTTPRSGPTLWSPR